MARHDVSAFFIIFFLPRESDSFEVIPNNDALDSGSLSRCRSQIAQLPGSGAPSISPRDPSRGTHQPRPGYRLALSTALSLKLLVPKVQQTFGRDHIVSVTVSCVHQSSLTPGEYDGPGEWQNVLFIADGYVFKSSPRGEETRGDSSHGYTEPVLL